ncbi:MAG TPA: hypothetical protein VJT09_07450 [Pyrinomonadaceae bacterium]|nr:hypothetical protein [Pyrinomonadaceae bacterium]
MKLSLANLPYRILLTSLAVLGLSGTTLAQNRQLSYTPPPSAGCSLTLAQAPELWGFRLRMTAEQVRARFPGIVMKPADSLGVIELDDVLPAVHSAPNRSDRWRAQGLFKLRLLFIDEQLAYIGGNYGVATQWANQDDFISSLSKSLGLPNAWYLKDQTDVVKLLKCDGFMMFAYSSPLAAVGMGDSQAFDKVDKREAAIDEADKKKGRKRLDYVYY